jgi:hypothetical protein
MVSVAMLILQNQLPNPSKREFDYATITHRLSLE